VFSILSAASSQEPDGLALVGGTIYPAPDSAPVRDGVVLVQGGKITALGPRRTIEVPTGSKVIDCVGMFVVAGFQNSHVHFTPPGWKAESSAPAADLANQLEAMVTRWGFTTVVDTGSDPSSTGVLRKRIESGEVNGPRILTAGVPLYPPKGIPFYIQDLPPDLLKLLPQPATPAAATAAVRDQSSYADLVKLFVGSWVTRGKVLPMPMPIATAAAREAHRSGKLVFAHPSNVAGLDVALGARVDVLAHALDDTRGFTNAHFAQMRRQNMGMIPTLTLFKGDPDIVAEVGTYFKLGGQILFGTDVGFLSDLDPTPEYELMARAGLRWQDILASLTTNPSARFRESRQRGRLQRGMDGDVVVLKNDPAVDVRAFGSVKHTIRRGRLIFSSP
jgi:imidazolonepropionase-like amidohydrolase